MTLSLSNLYIYENLYEYAATAEKEIDDMQQRILKDAQQEKGIFYRGARKKRNRRLTMKILIRRGGQ